MSGIRAYDRLWQRHMDLLHDQLRTVESRNRWRSTALGAIFGSIFATWPSASNPWQHALIVAVVILVISVLWWLDRASDGVTP